MHFLRTNFLQFISRDSSCFAKSLWHFFGSGYEHATEKLADCQEHSLGNDVSNFSLLFIFCLSSFPFQNGIFPVQKNCCVELSTYDTILECCRRTLTREEQSNYPLEWSLEQHRYKSKLAVSGHCRLCSWFSLKTHWITIADWLQLDISDPAIKINIYKLSVAQLVQNTKQVSKQQYASQRIETANMHSKTGVSALTESSGSWQE